MRSQRTDPSLEDLYETMVRIRAVEHVQRDWWERGLVSGEMHSGIGEEAIAAGIAAHLRAGDAVACDHRPTGPFVAAGIDLETLLLELLGHDRGLNRGWAGHMHLMAPDLLHMADGIVGSAGPAACGFALSGTLLRPGSIAVAYFGEGALNQGMLMESFNLAKTWSLPVLFVCKDNRWSITTRSRSVTAGSPLRRAAGFELRRTRVEGSDVAAVSRVSGRLISRMRRRPGPAFLHVTCHRPDGHFLGDPLLRVVRRPVAEARSIGIPMLQAARRGGGTGALRRLAASTELGRRVVATAVGRIGSGRRDPLQRARRRLEPGAARSVEERVEAGVGEAAAGALRAAGVA